MTVTRLGAPPLLPLCPPRRTSVHYYLAYHRPLLTEDPTDNPAQRSCMLMHSFSFFFFFFYTSCPKFSNIWLTKYAMTWGGAIAEATAGHG